MAPRWGCSFPGEVPDCETPGAIRCEEYFFPDAEPHCDIAAATRCAAAWDFPGVPVAEEERIVLARDRVAQAPELLPEAASC